MERRRGEFPNSDWYKLKKRPWLISLCRDSVVGPGLRKGRLSRGLHAVSNSELLASSNGFLLRIGRYLEWIVDIIKSDGSCFCPSVGNV